MYVAGGRPPITLSPLQSCDVLVTQGQFIDNDFISRLRKQWRTANWWQLLASDHLYLIGPIRSDPASDWAAPKNPQQVISKSTWISTTLTSAGFKSLSLKIIMTRNILGILILIVLQEKRKLSVSLTQQCTLLHWYQLKVL